MRFWLGLILNFCLAGFSARAETSDPAAPLPTGVGVGVTAPRQKLRVHRPPRPTEGFRVALVKGFLSARAPGQDLAGKSFVMDGAVPDDLGVSLGYAYIPLMWPGFLAQLDYREYDAQTEGLRAQTNVTFGLHKMFYLLAGLNLHQFVKGAAGLNLGLGYQAGFGVQINRWLGADLEYIDQSSSGTYRYVHVDYVATGPELYLHSTF